MKIGLIVPGFSANEQDWCIPAVRNLVRGLAQDHDVHVFALRYPHRRETYSVAGATVHALGGGTRTGVGRLPILTRCLLNLVEEGRPRFDVLHGLWADEPGGVAVAAGRVADVPVIVSLLGGELVGFPELGYGGRLSRVNHCMTRIAMRKAQRVTVGSSYLSQLACDYLSGRSPILMPLGIDTEMFCPGTVKDGCGGLDGNVKLLHPASLVPVKDQATLLRAFSRVLDEAPAAGLHIVGDGPLLRDLERQASSLGVTPRVTFHGAVPHGLMPDYYRAADLCMLTSVHESQGMVTLEAAGCARTTVGTEVGLLPDFVPRTQVVPVGDADGLAQTTLRTLEDRDRLAALGRAARRSVEANYALRHTIAQLNDLYLDVVAEHGIGGDKRGGMAGPRGQE